MSVQLQATAVGSRRYAKATLRRPCMCLTFPFEWCEHESPAAIMVGGNQECHNPRAPARHLINGHLSPCHHDIRSGSKTAHQASYSSLALTPSRHKCRGALYCTPTPHPQICSPEGWPTHLECLVLGHRHGTRRVMYPVQPLYFSCTCAGDQTGTGTIPVSWYLPAMSVTKLN